MLECLECVFVKHCSYLRQLEIFGIECDIDIHIEISNKAFDYIFLINSLCTIPESLMIDINKFIRINCKDCG